MQVRPSLHPVPEAKPTDEQSSSVVQHRSGFFFVQLASNASATIIDVFTATVFPMSPRIDRGRDCCVTAGVEVGRALRGRDAT